MIEELIDRLKKNERRLKSYLKSEGIVAFRLYDQDLPNFPLIIEIYGNVAVLTHRGKSFFDDDVKKIDLVKEHLESQYELKKVHVKVRESSKGGSQYGKNTRFGEEFWIEENGLEFKINCDRYLDNGLFLDHRPLRKWLKKSKAKTVLNLFSYTCSLSVAAAFNGAKTVNVDLSRTYLDWGKENFKRNSLKIDQHQFIVSDIFDYLNNTDETFDLIVCDAPTFSNSKKIERDWQIEDDHYELLIKLKTRLNKQGSIFFGGNARNFKLDQKTERLFSIENWTEKSCPMDFRDQKIHFLFRLIDL